MDHSEVVEKIRLSIAVIFILDGKGDVIGKGSGFVFGKKDILVTCNHVIVGEGVTVMVKFPDNNFLKSDIVVRDEEHDLALLRFEDKKDRVPLDKADAKSIKEGIPVIFSGYPLDLISLTTHQGILSAIIKDAKGITTYLIDGTVNSGNSGCPLMTIDGSVIGVVNAKRRERSDLLYKVEEMKTGAVSLHGVDFVEIYQALISNLQLGIGFAVPCSYIPQHIDPEIIFDDLDNK